MGWVVRRGFRCAAGSSKSVSSRAWSVVRAATALGSSAPYSAANRAMPCSAVARVSAFMLSCSARLARGCRVVGSLSRTLASRCTQQRGSAVSGQTSRTAAQNPSAPIPDRQDRGPQAPRREVAQDPPPDLGALPVAVLPGDDLLGPVGAHADEDQGAQPLLLRADPEVDPVSPEGDVVAVGQGAAPEARVRGPPHRRQPLDGAGRQPGGVGPEQGRQGLPEVPGGQPVQVEPGQDALPPRRPAQGGRQDPAREPLALALHHPAVVHPRGPDPHRAHPRQHRPGPRPPVAHHAGMAGPVPRPLVPGHVLVGLHPQRRRDHPLGPGPGQFVQGPPPAPPSFPAHRLQ
jgi:hypothetical protein